MPDDTTTEAATFTPAASWSRAILTYAAFAAALGAVSILGVMLIFPLIVVPILVLGAIPYTVVATVVVLRRRRAGRADLDAGSVDVDESVASFGSWPQRWSLLNGGLLGVVGLALLMNIWVEVEHPEAPDATVFLCALAAMFSVVEICINVPWIYGRRTILAEEHALRTRTRAWKLILLNRVLGWVIWYSGCAVAGGIIVFYVSSAIGLA